MLEPHPKNILGTLPPDLAGRREELIRAFGYLLFWARHWSLSSAEGGLSSPGSIPGAIHRKVYERAHELGESARAPILEFTKKHLDELLYALTLAIDEHNEYEVGPDLWVRYRLVAEMINGRGEVVEKVPLNADCKHFFGDYFIKFLNQFDRPELWANFDEREPTASHEGADFKPD